MFIFLSGLRQLYRWPCHWHWLAEGVHWLLLKTSIEICCPLIKALDTRNHTDGMTWSCLFVKCHNWNRNCSHKTTWLYYLYLVHYSKSNNNLITTILHVFKFKYLILLQNLKLKSEIHDSWIDYRSTVNAWCRVCTRAIFNLSLQDLTIGYIALKLSWKLEFWFYFICPDIISLVGNFKANSDISNIFIKLSAFCSTVFGKVIIGPFV